jgi:hypothetical protein
MDENRARLKNAVDKPVTRINESWAAEMATSIRADAPMTSAPHLQNRGVADDDRISPAVSADMSKLTPEMAGRIRDFLKRKE